MKIFSYAYFALVATVASAASPDDPSEGNTLRRLDNDKGVDPECVQGCQFFFKEIIGIKTAPDFCKFVIGLEPGELGECVSTVIALADEAGFPKSAGQLCTKCCRDDGLCT